MKKRKVVLASVIDAIAVLVSLGLLFYKPWAALIAFLGILLASLIPWLNLLYHKIDLKTKSVALLITYIRLVLVTLSCTVPGLVWYFVPGLKEEVPWAFIFFGAIEALVYYLLERMVIAVSDLEEEYTEKKE